jgi:hypothetical protein
MLPNLVNSSQFKFPRLDKPKASKTQKNHLSRLSLTRLDLTRPGKLTRLEPFLTRPIPFWPMNPFHKSEPETLNPLTHFTSHPAESLTRPV